MRTYTFRDSPPHRLVFLMTSVLLEQVKKEYLDPFGISTDHAKCITLHTSGKKTPVKEMKAFIEEELKHELTEAKYLVVTDAGYYKLLTGQDTAEGNFGYVQDYLHGPQKVVYVPSARSIFYDPAKTRGRIRQGMEALLAHAKGKYKPPGDGVIKFEAYPSTDQEISEWLDKLLEMGCPLSVDIEAFSLKHYSSGIGTITLCWSKHEGVAFPVDYVSQEWEDDKGKKHFGTQVRNEYRRELLRRFFSRLMEKTLYHNISFDVTVLVAQLFMRDLLDTEGLLHGMKVMLRNWDDTQLITYLATNTCAGNELGLKPNSQEFSGNYSQDDIKDITLIKLEDLLRYNLVDGLSTWYVYEKNYPKMVADNQLPIYQTLFKPSVLDIIQAQLTGLPLDMNQVKWVKQVLEAVEVHALKRVHESQVVQEFTYTLREQYVVKRNSELKKKRISMTDDETLAVNFNPNSDPQLRCLLYEQLNFPVIDLTDSKLPSTGSKTIKKFLNIQGNPDKVKDFLEALVEYLAVEKILEFVAIFETAVQGPDGWHYLFGSFKLGGTLSGRLSSSGPNLQNLPSNVEMAISSIFLSMFSGLGKFIKKGILHLGKLIKSCVKAPRGWIFVGSDFMSLEDRISALTTKDPNKLKVYTDGYDAHSLNAQAYFPEDMPDIDPKSVDSINSIKVKYPVLRQDGKSPTFAMTYQGTYRTLMVNCGFPEDRAKRTVGRYQEFYQVSIRWVQDKLNQASKDGYVTGAFGLRIRTPLLVQTIRGTKRTPYEAEAEGRSAGNALGQSWCLLTNRASAEFMGKVRASEYRLDIKPVAFVHDANYHLVRDDVRVVMFINEHLREANRWQEHPDITHDKVKLDGAVSLFYPDWSNEIELPYKADENTIRSTIKNALSKIV